MSIQNLAKSFLDKYDRVAILNNQSKIVIEFDATVSISHQREANITSYMIEDGSRISDHVSMNNPSVTIDATISDFSPNTFDGLAGSAVTSLVNYVTDTNLIPTEAVSIAGLLNNTQNRKQVAYDILKEVLNTKQLYKLKTGFEIYDNILIRSMSVTETSNSVSSLNVSLTIEQVRIVKTQKDKINPLALNESVRASGSLFTNDGLVNTTNIQGNISNKANSFSDTLLGVA